MDLVFLNRCYWPDVEATGQLLTELCSDLARGHQVTVIAGQPNFVDVASRRLIEREVHDGVNIIRVRNSRFSKKSLVGRILGLSGYLLLAAWSAFTQRRPDVIVTETDPPVLGALGALLKAWHRCGLVYYLQDLYPEVGLTLGKLRPGPLAWFLRWATQFGLRHADRIVVLGEDMRRRVLDRGIPSEKIVIIPNWVDIGIVRPLCGANRLRKDWGLDACFVVMYSGNLGLSQNLEQILLAARELREEGERSGGNPPVHFLFVGEGAAKARLEARAAEWSLDNVSFRPYQPKEALSESLGVADVHLIPLQKGLAGCIVPSKLYGILAAGKPYIAAVDADSEVARITNEAKTGLVIQPDSAAELVAAVRWCLAHGDELATMGQTGRQVAAANFDRSIATADFERVVCAVCPPRAAEGAMLSLPVRCSTNGHGRVGPGKHATRAAALGFALAAAKTTI
jgi:colanic acid biosynthesis glycosyl transferase WcaI